MPPTNKIGPDKARPNPVFVESYGQVWRLTQQAWRNLLKEIVRTGYVPSIEPFGELIVPNLIQIGHYDAELAKDDLNRLDRKQGDPDE